ncbi:RNA polymerase sigma-70 factor [Formosa sp. PL04]|uniref:RNA polymerase sigma-70 factor n=1 Tax=Formosa sp. PL04 TaxID=3081755 RepID=UPI0029816F12|nr:RNA polymerase sigma-70 factor [Formosa sp. PL04]MDW5290161.1 RNA polymerase sigma-70 factor [Formosa sp. PL04]
MNQQAELDFDLVFNTYWSGLYIYAYNILKDRSASEDIVQDVFLDFWKRSFSVEISHVKAYFYQAVKYQCVNELKKRKITSVDLEHIESLFLQDDLPSDFNYDDKTLGLISMIIDEKLPLKCKEIFKLRYYEDISPKEIAVRLNISVSTVENQIYKALKILRSNSDLNLNISMLILIHHYSILY